MKLIRLDFRSTIGERIKVAGYQCGRLLDAVLFFVSFGIIDSDVGAAIIFSDWYSDNLNKRRDG